MYRNLNADKVLETLGQLHARIDGHFPGAGLSRVCAEVIAAGRSAAVEARALARPNWPLRVAVVLILALGIGAQLWAAYLLHLPRFDSDAPGLIQGLEAAVNLLFLFGGAAWFLITIEERLKRRRALAALHGLRSLAHVVDMHQLTKDPTLVLQQAQLRAPTAAVRAMTHLELTRYLDYCAQVLSLLGKLAALYGDRMRDATVISVVNDLEDLTGTLGRKIWQKITIISALDEHAAAARGAAAVKA